MAIPSLTLDLIMSLDTESKALWDQSDVEGELHREVFEKCAAIDGTWGVEAAIFDLSLKVAEPLLRDTCEGKPDLTVSDCALAGLQIQQGTRKKPLHPLQVLELAYGLAEDGKL